MPSNKPTTELGILELYRVSLENAEKQPVIAESLDELGLDEVAIGEGKAMLKETRQAYEVNVKEDDETKASYVKFTNLKQELEDTYSLHRKKAKVVFRKDPVTLESLGIEGRVPRTFPKLMETTRRFYDLAVTNTSIQEKIARLKVTLEDLQAGQTKITEVEAARADYLREKGESEDATKIKDAAFAKMDDWMSEFYAIAKIGLEDHPQLLEALGKNIKN